MVEHNADPASVLVRCRTRGDAQALIDWQERNGVAYAQVAEDPQADYRWRVVMLRADFAEYARESVMDIDYMTNVKGNLDHGDPVRHKAMLGCWNALYALQVAPDIRDAVIDTSAAMLDLEPSGDDWQDVYDDVTPESLAAWLHDAEGEGLDTAATAAALLKHFEMYRIGD